MTSAQLLLEIMTEFREADPSTPVSVSNTEALEYLNWAYQDFVVNARPMRGYATVSIMPENSIVANPKDCIKLDDIYQGQTKLEIRTYEQMDDIEPRWRNMSTSDRCTRYIPLSWNTGETYPTKSNAGTITFFGYYSMPATLTLTGSDPLIPEQVQCDMKQYVLALMHAKTRNLELAMNNVNTYSAKRNEFAQGAFREWTDGKTLTMKLPSRTTYGRIRKDR